MRLKKFVCAFGLFFSSTAAQAHHEAIFGPQSSLFMSNPHFVSLQVFSRQTGVSNQRTQETTGLVSVGTGKKGSPWGFTAILPYSFLHELDVNGSTSGPEDWILGVRYLRPIESLQRRWDKEGNFVLALGAAEVNNGSVDHAAWHGPVDGMTGLLGSLEKGPVSGIGYAYYRTEGRYNDGSRAGDNLFFGGGLAYTPHEDESSGRLYSFQLGYSYEIYGKDKAAGVTDPDSGGTTWLLHPTFVFARDHHRLYFFVVSVPVRRDFRNDLDQDRFRLGTGCVWSW